MIDITNDDLKKVIIKLKKNYKIIALNLQRKKS